MENKTPNHWPKALKVLATCFILSTLIGYFIGLVKIYQISHFGLGEAAVYYAGDQQGNENADEASLNLPQSFEAMLSITHVHAFSQPLVFALMGLIFVFTKNGERYKIGVIIALFMATLVGNAGPWLTKYSANAFIWSMCLSQIAIVTTLLTMSCSSLKQMWCYKNK